MASPSKYARISVWWAALLLGGVSFAFSYGNNASPYAAWITPVLLLVFTRHTPVLIGFFAMLIVTAIASYFAFDGMMPGDEIEGTIALALSGGVATALVFAIDRLVAPRLGELAATLVLPTAVVSLLYIASLGAPFGTWGNDAYAQGELLFVSRFASVFGLWGVAFLPPWVASVLVTRAQRFQRAAWSASVPTLTIVVAFVVGHGVFSGFGWNRNVKTIRTAMTAIEIDGLPAHACDADDLVCKQTALDEAINDPLFALSSAAVGEGADLIAWHEGAAFAYASFEGNLLKRARDFARANDIYLVTAIGILPDRFPDGLIENKAVLITPDGTVSTPYFKAHPVPGEPVVKGDGAPVVVETPFGRVGLLICFDADFTEPARLAAKAGAQMLVIPSNDWRAITPLHGEMTRFRAIENGVTVVRPASNGLAVAYDPTGRPIAQLNAFRSQKGYTVFDLPVASRDTVNRYLGDGFALGSLAGLGLLMLLGSVGALRRR